MKDDYQKKFTPPCSLDNWFQVFSLRLCKSLYVIKQKVHLELCVPLAIRFPIANYCTVWDGAVAFKGSHRMGSWRNLLKISAPLPLIKIYQMRPFAARSILQDSSFNTRWFGAPIVLAFYNRLEDDGPSCHVSLKQITCLLRTRWQPNKKTKESRLSRFQTNNSPTF